MTTEKKTTIGKVLKLFRLTVEEDFTCAKLAERIGFSPTYISEIENDKKQPSFNSLKKFAEFFNVPSYKIFKIVEDANESSWTHERTFLEVVKTYLEHNNEN